MSEKHTITKEEIVNFAMKYDPQYMHIDEEKAKKSIFNNIIASGLHTLAITFKLWHTIFNLGDQVIAGKAINNLKLIKPVYPKDSLYVTSEVIQKKERKKHGEIIVLIKTYKETGIKVLQFESVVLVKK